MDAPKFTLSKAERLSGKNNIDLLFTQGHSFVVFPFRIVYTFLTASQQESRAAMFVSVPKKKFKRAVKRNLIRRRVKEAYRLNKHLLLPVLEEQNLHVAIAFLYLDREVREYHSIESKIKELLTQFAARIKEQNAPVNPEQ